MINPTHFTWRNRNPDILTCIANLATCCARLNIPLNHHNALSDALGCAKLFLHHREV